MPARQARYPVFANACTGCGGAINFSRGGSTLDYVCNVLVNPRPEEQFDRTPRRFAAGIYGYEDRLEVARRLHTEMRGIFPGWGRLELNDIIRRYDQLEAEAYGAALEGVSP